MKSISGMPEGAILHDTYDPEDLTQRYFTKNGTEITVDVLTVAGYSYTVKANKAKRFRLRLKRTGDPAEACWGIAAQDETEGNLSSFVIDVNQPADECD